MPKKATKTTVKKLISDVKKLNSDEVREVETAVHERMKETYNIPGMRVYGYIPKELADIAEPMVEWAYKLGYIPKPSMFSFTSWAVKLTLLKVYEDVVAEEFEQVEIVEEEDSGGS